MTKTDSLLATSCEVCPPVVAKHKYDEDSLQTGGFLFMLASFVLSK
jgi:hypothetical protein